MSVVLALAAAPEPADAEPPGKTTEQQLAAAAEQLEIVIEQYNGLHEELRGSRVRAAELDRDLAVLADAMTAHRAEAARLAAQVYRGHGAQPLAAVSALLTASTDDLLGSLLMLNRLSRDQRRIVAQLAVTHDQLSVARAEARALDEQQRVQERQLALRKQHIEGEISRLSRLRDATGEREPAPPRSAPRPPGDLGSGAAASAVRFAYAQLGKRYQWGGEGPDGYDCSGLTSAAWRAGGVQLPHNAARQWRVVKRISRAERQPGDLVFYYADIHHVGIYVGDGNIIHAPRSGKPVQLERVDYQPIHGYGRPT
ncbi:C40 family peptidase [Micromonospora sp. NBC_01796]|uniref:C40 family peptidase n=1 Tax=Micromonospora sp. NBC_01796 TaxID=2975987 RepID=UPI002DDC7FFE|nr:NlpC/P60 family protein [Micromonospora sp. NBC_01796]WSA87840.1 NlpC/P60 family protein [Micromonospora sp. NBC_01796]